MFEFDKANGVIERGELLYSIPHDSEIVLDTGVPAYSGPALLKFKYPVKHAPSALIVTQTVAEKLNEKRASIVVEIIRRWKDIPKADLARIILGAGAYSGGFSLSPIEKIEESITSTVLNSLTNLSLICHYQLIRHQRTIRSPSQYLAKNGGHLAPVC